MTTGIDWGTVLLDTVKELAAQPGGEPWTAVAEGLVKLLEEHATLKAEVERLRSCDRTNIREQARLINERDTMKEALRRVVEIMRDAISREAFSYLDEAFAIAKGVMEK